MILNLDSQFKPYKSKKEILFKQFVFPGGEPHIKIEESTILSDEVTITHRVDNFNKIGEILLANDALHRMGFSKINLTIPYFPAARQDRVMVKGEPLTVKIYADIINGCNFNKVTIFDAHSEVAPALLNNCEVVTNNSFIDKVVKEINEDVFLISPDGGALKKIYKIATHLVKYEVIECSKSRDVASGVIKDFKVYADDLNNKSCLIVDDICDGGGTFLGLAKALKEKNAGSLYLAVSHGIFSNGLSNLNQCFDKIFTTDSFKTFDNNQQFAQFKLADGLLS